MSDKELTQALAATLDSHIEGLPREVRIKKLAEAIESITYGMRAGIPSVVDALIRETLGEHYAGPGKLRDRVRALEGVARSAMKVVAFDGDIMSAAFEARIADLTAALEPLNVAPPTKTG